MIGSALYLMRCSLINATRRRVARLRQPKYLIAFVVGCLYLYWLLVGRHRPTGWGTAGVPGGEVVAVGLLGLLVVLNVVFGRTETPFGFTLAETQYLFPAPLTRRQVIDFKLLRLQLPLLLSAVVTGLVFTSGPLGGARLLRFVGLWLVYGTLQLHYAGISLVRASLAQHGLTGLRRRLATLLVLASVAALTWWGLRQELPAVAAAFRRDPRSGAAALAGVMHSGVLGVLLWPLRALVAPLLAESPAAFAVRLPPALLVLAAHYVWVVRSSLAFEEAAVEHAATVARRIEAVRQGRSLYRRPRPPKAAGAIPLRLRPTGRASAAFLWKNVVGATRDVSPRTLFLIAVIGLSISLGLASGAVRGADLLAVMLLAFGAMALVFGPFALRFDLRRDLAMLDVLKSYPVRGREVVAGEVAAPVTLLSLVVWACCGGAFAASALRPPGGLPPLADQLALLVAVLPATTAVLLVLVVVQNTAVLLFPAWVSIGPDRAGGLEATGQRILMMAGSVIALAVALVPAVIAAAIATAVAHAAAVPGLWAVTLGTFAGAAIVAGEGVIAVQLLGGVFDRMEPGAAGPG